MKAASELEGLLQRKHWDKDLVLWVGSEGRLAQALRTAPVTPLDLLDLFDPNSLPMDDEETRCQLQQKLRARLQSLAPGDGQRRVLVVRSIGLLARYRVDVSYFYEWFCNDFAMAILVLGRLPASGLESEDVACVPGRLADCFRAPERVKQVYGE